MPTLLLAEDHGLVRSGLRLLLETRPELRVVAEAADGREAVRLAAELHPDLALLDVFMPNLNGIEAARHIRHASPHIRILMVSMQTDYQFVYESFRAGANGYLLKQSAVAELLAAIQLVLAGETFLSPAVASADARTLIHSPSRRVPSTQLDKLSAREREVLQLVAEGNSAAEIAAGLALSTRTVETYRERLMLKLDLHSIADLTRFAVRHGLCAPEH